MGVRDAQGQESGTTTEALAASSPTFNREYDVFAAHAFPKKPVAKPLSKELSAVHLVTVQNEEDREDPTSLSDRHLRSTASRSSPQQVEGRPREFFCPWCDKIMTDPVTLDTQTNCCKACVHKLGGICPETGLNLSSSVVENNDLKERIQGRDGSLSTSESQSNTSEPADAPSPASATTRVTRGAGEERAEGAGDMSDLPSDVLRQVLRQVLPIPQVCSRVLSDSRRGRLLLQPDGSLTTNDSPRSLEGPNIQESGPSGNGTALSQANRKRPRAESDGETAGVLRRRISDRTTFDDGRDIVRAEQDEMLGAAKREQIKGAGAVSDEQTPKMFKCPITWELMEDPVIALDGHTYERHAIENWFRHKRASPVTNLRLSQTQLIPNYNLRSAIKDWQERAAKPNASL